MTDKEESAWERDLRELKQLMRNEVTNHERIRSRVLLLRERFYDGEIQTKASNWEQWAIGYFAYSASYLKRLLNPHPLSSGNWENQQQKDQAAIVSEHDKLERARRNLENKEELRRIKEATMRAKEPIKAKPKLKMLPKPVVDPGQPAEIALPHLNACTEIERKSRVELGKEYTALRELAHKGLLGKNPKGRLWGFKPWCETYIKKSHRDIYRCIDEYHNQLKVENVTSCHTIQESSVIPIKRHGTT
jgi:hypothetical protein